MTLFWYDDYTLTIISIPGDKDIQKNTQPPTHSEFEEWAHATKEALNSMEHTLNEHTQILHEHTRILEKIATGICDMVQEQKAITRLYFRLDNRDHVFAKKLDFDLAKIDAEFQP